MSSLEQSGKRLNAGDVACRETYHPDPRFSTANMTSVTPRRKLRVMRLILVFVAAAATVLAGLPTAAHAHSVPIRAACKERPAHLDWPGCVRKAKAHNMRHLLNRGKAKCVAAGGRHRYCRAMIAATRQEPVPMRWAWDPDLVFVVGKESGFNHCAVNPSRHVCSYTGNRAYGYGQMLKSTEQDYNCRPRPSPPKAQARCVLKYVKRRYYSPAGAKRFWDRNHWY